MSANLVRVEWAEEAKDEDKDKDKEEAKEEAKEESEAVVACCCRYSSTLFPKDGANTPRKRAVLTTSSKTRDAKASTALRL
ncbi:hypothetical protein THAR02_04338 [Trichoderma harzianum]|uniref:Uncharacterized protein n=1 Tax=Trichoderma harzianum TaxID=5544 RepID=A0A0F9XEV6_TRIHA|nr:hypothetical protein THAR02_04338 [Trichoderma harzianum]